jgi:CHAD domain-containing protein
MAIEDSMADGHSQGNGKWVGGLATGMPVGKAASRVLGARLAVVREAVPAASGWGSDGEPVHHLRVASRRASAALDAFDDLLPAKSVRKARKSLKRLRRAAGAARNADVFLTALRTWLVHQSPADRPGLHFLLGHAFAAREEAQIGLTAALRDWDADDAAEVNALPDELRGGKKETLGERAVPQLTKLLRKLDKAVRGDLENYEQLHGVRVLAKQLRYALELFIDCYPPVVREQIYPRVEAVQDVLGAANDSHQAVVLLDTLRTNVVQAQPALWDAIRGGIDGVRAHHQQRERDQRTAFWDWWRQWQALRPEVLLGEVVSERPAEPAPRLAAL